MTNSIELLENFKDLPDEVQKVISSFKYDEALKGVHEKYKLHIDQASALEKELAKVIFGETKPQQLIPHVQQELHIPAEKAREIVFDVNTSILIPLQNLMKEEQTKETKEEGF